MSLCNIGFKYVDRALMRGARALEYIALNEYHVLIVLKITVLGKKEFSKSVQ